MLFSIITAKAEANPQESNPTLEAHVFFNPSTPEGPKLMVVLIFINTTDESITVLTKSGTSIYAPDAKGPKVLLGFTKSKKRFGHELLPSISALEPVTLRPGEATELTAEVSSKYLESLKDGDEIRVEYDILDKWAERFNLWDADNETITTVKAY